MQVCNGLDSYPADAAPVVATIGNYDGVHLGHRRILERVRADARARGLDSLLLTFDPHPVRVLAPDHDLRLLMTRRQKLDALEAAGLDGVLILRFDETTAALSGEAFFARLLAGRLRIAALHVGRNFRFGRGRTGDLALLEQVGRREGFEVRGIEPVTVDGTVVSSTAIRRLLAEGDVERAWRLLGHPFELDGTVVRGAGRGGDLGFPTANLHVDNETVPAVGVYVTEARHQAARYPSMTNVGIRPTFGGNTLVVETHLLDFDGRLYEERLSLRFLARLRDERRFEDPSALADQLALDRAAAAAFFHNLQPAHHEG